MIKDTTFVGRGYLENLRSFKIISCAEHPSAAAFQSDNGVSR